MHRATETSCGLARSQMTIATGTTWLCGHAKSQTCCFSSGTYLQSCRNLARCRLDSRLPSWVILRRTKTAVGRGTYTSRWLKTCPRNQRHRMAMPHGNNFRTLHRIVRVPCRTFLNGKSAHRTVVVNTTHFYLFNIDTHGIVLLTTNV